MHFEFGQKIIDFLRGKERNKNYKIINEHLSKVKYVHVMHNDIFNKPFVDFLNENFDKKEHLVLCKRWEKHPFPEGENVFEIKSLNNLDFSNIEKLICHSFFDSKVVEYLYKNQDILKNKTYWISWGGDLYNAKRDKVNDFVRKNCKGYAGLIDRQYSLNKYHMNDNFYNIHYIFPTLLTKDEENHKNINKNYIQIQINNSCDKSTLEMLDVLSKFKDKNIKVTTIVSYGQIEFKDEIIKKGKEIFKDKFEYLANYISPEEYKKYVRNNDILILNQNRQQGIGNTLLNIQNGAKVFIRNNISTYEYFNNINKVKIFDTLSIPELSFEDFIKNDFVQNNIENIKEHTDVKLLAKLWENFFNA